MLFVNKQVAINQARRESRNNGFVWYVSEDRSTNLKSVGMRPGLIVIARFQRGKDFK